MKEFKFLLLSFGICLLSNQLYAQDELKRFDLSLGAGYEQPFFLNNTPYIKYQPGFTINTGLRYHWSKWGIGLEYQYIRNWTKNQFPDQDIYDQFGNQIDSLFLREGKIRSSFLGIGPSYIFWRKERFRMHSAILVGVSDIVGARMEFLGHVANTPQLLNFHAGYYQKNLPSAKAKIGLDFRINRWMSIEAELYYLHHFKATEEVELGRSAYYHPFQEMGASNTLTGSPYQRSEPCNCNVSSLGLVGKLNLRFPKREDKDCGLCNNTLTITARDKISNQLLPNTDVVLIDSKGAIIKAAETNSFGVVVFDQIAAEDYEVKGKLYGQDLSSDKVLATEFKNVNNVQKSVLYEDENFILKGKVVECGIEKPIQGVNILLMNNEKAKLNSTLSDENGLFSFKIAPHEKYILKGQKDGYFSNAITISTNDYDRQKTLLIDFQMCVDPCGVAIRLDHINFDLDKWNILPEALGDLNRVIDIMKSNPEISVEMSSHTDCRGSREYNFDLSQKRAASTVDYMVGKGINRDRCVARGAGELELLNDCTDGINCPEEKHKVNRRTEFKIICP
ncbi:MAG: OmpA family protein [Flavobacteriales bacterium]|nr:OmpA family protein [Flavobacteriales bacterium]